MLAGALLRMCSILWLILSLTEALILCPISVLPSGENRNASLKLSAAAAIIKFLRICIVDAEAGQTGQILEQGSSPDK